MVLFSESCYIEHLRCYSFRILIYSFKMEEIRPILHVWKIQTVFIYFFYLFQYVENVPKWSAGCEAPAPMATVLPQSKAGDKSSSGKNSSSSSAGKDSSGSGNNPNDIPTLEATIHHHQSLYENMCQAYTEVHSTSKKLLYQLDHLVQLCNQTKEDRKHVSYQLLDARFFPE